MEFALRHFHSAVLTFVIRSAMFDASSLSKPESNEVTTRIPPFAPVVLSDSVL